MSPAVVSSLGIVAYLAFFATVGILFLFVNLLVGRLVRPFNPHPEKQETYECGEPAIGSSYVQFDLRFYVVALLFIIFDVEVAFFFPWATVFGKSVSMADPNFEVTIPTATGVSLTDAGRDLYQELGIRSPQAPTSVPASLQRELGTAASPEQIVKAGAQQLAWVTIVNICVFFAILLVGFAYVWNRGDLDWVRAVNRQRAGVGPPSADADQSSHEQALSA